MKNETSDKQGKPLSGNNLEKVTGGEYDFVSCNAAIPLITSDGVELWATTLQTVYRNDDDKEFILSYITNSEDKQSSTFIFRDINAGQDLLIIKAFISDNRTNLIRYQK